MAELKTIPGADRRIRRTRGRLVRIALVEAMGLAALFAALYLLLAMSGFLERLPVVAQASAALLFLAGFGVLALRARRRYRAPRPADAIAALDRQSDLRPLSSLSDRPAQSDADGRRLWDAHQARLAEAVRELRVPGFAAEWRSVDPYALRFAVPLALGAVLAVNFAAVPERLERAFAPDFGSLVGADNLRVEAWITPPAYSGRAPVFLDADTPRVRVPAGSELTLRAFGRAAPLLAIAGSEGHETRRFDAMPDGAYEASAVITADSAVSVRWWGERAAWTILASPDDPPEARFVETPSVTPQDRTDFTWAASDDYGVDGLVLALTLQTPDPADPGAEDRVAVPLPGTGVREASEQAELDLTRHRWAGLPVNARIIAIDGAGQEGASDPFSFTLPEKLFLQPLAKAAQEVRVTVLREPADYAAFPVNSGALRADGLNTLATARLEAAPSGVRQAAVMLDALTYEPARYFEDPSLYLGLRAAEGVLVSAASKAEADTVDPLLWAVAMKAEYGSAADALRALMAAKKALEQALRNGASEDEIRRLMEAFREAANNYVAAKMAEAMANGGEPAPMTEDGMAGGGPGLGSNDFEDMLNALEDLAETGASDQARQLLSDITNMLENLEFQQGGSGGEGGWPGMPGQSADSEGDSEGSAEEQELTGALERLSELLREQRELNDDTMQAERGQPGGSPFGEGGLNPPPGEGEGNGEGREPDGGQGGLSGLADRQDSLGGLADRFAEAIERGEIGGPGDDAEDGDGPGAADPESEGEGEGAGSSGQDRQGEAFAGFGGLGEEAREALEAIARAQRRAADALERGDTARARRLQDGATRDLRDLSGDLAGALDQLAEAREGSDADAAADTDPFGRPVGGVNDGREVTIPEQAERQRAKDILDELRQRYDRAVDEDERQYLRRLLDRF